MSVFRLQMRDGVSESGTVRFEADDAQAARLHAIRQAGDALQAEPQRVIGQDLRVEVSTVEGLLLFSVIVIGVQSAAAQLDRI